MRYLIMTYITRPSGKIDEAMEVSTRIKPRDWQTASVILDFKKLTVEKSSMAGTIVPKDFNRIVQYYRQHYEKTIDRLFKENGFEVVTNEQPKEQTPHEEQNNSN